MLLSPMIVRSLVAVLAYTFLATWCRGQTASGVTHGTVNIILANANGAVVVTDSRLSSGGHSTGESPKLFQLDETTVCAIAGFYSDPGPKSGGYMPAATTIPFLMALYAARHLENPTIEQKLDAMAEIFQFNLAFVAAAREATLASQDPPSPSELTLVSYENKHIVIAGATLTPKIQDGVLAYFVTQRSHQNVDLGFVSRIEGISELADWYVAHPQQLASSRDPILRDFGTSMLNKNGTDIDLHFLLQIAKKMEFDTAQKYPAIVGGTLQIAEFENGRIKSFEGLPTDEKPFASLRVRLSGFRSTNATVAVAGVKPPAILLFDGGSIVGGKQLLDNLLIVHTTFEHCHLFYDGSPKTYFASDNVLIDTDLTLGSGVSDESVFVRFLHESYPDMIIKHASSLPLATPPG
jgi:hypothetical protein